MTWRSPVWMKFTSYAPRMPTTARTAEARSNILFDRFFARVFSSNQPVDASWVVVGSVALAKHLGAHRRINDVDIDYLRGDLPDAVRELTARLREPNPDGLEYSIFEQFHAELRVGRASSILVDSDGVNIKDFRIDLGVKSALTQPPVWKESPFIPEAEFGYRGALVAHPVDLLRGRSWPSSSHRIRPRDTLGHRRSLRT